MRRLVMIGPWGLAAAAIAIVSTRTRVSAKYCAAIAVSDHANGQIGSDLRDVLGAQIPPFSTIGVRFKDRVRAVAYLLTGDELRRAVRASGGRDAIARFDVAWYLAYHAVYRAIFVGRRPVGVLMVNDLSIERIAMLSAAARASVPIGLSLMDVPVKRLPPVRPDVVFAWDEWQGEAFRDSRVLVRPVPEIERAPMGSGSLRVLILASAFETSEELSQLADEISATNSRPSITIRTHPRVTVFDPVSDAVDRVVIGSDEPLTATLSQVDVVLGGESSSLFQARRWGWPTARADGARSGSESAVEPSGAAIPRLARPIKAGEIERLANLTTSRTIAPGEETDVWRHGWEVFLRGDSRDEPGGGRP